MILPVILSGGSGTRLWPLSRKDLPKQYISLLNNESLFTHTLTRLKALNSSREGHLGTERLFCVASESHRFLVAQELTEVFNSQNTSKTLQTSVILEPEPKNTAAAMALVALRANRDDLLLFCPADHYIPGTQQFVRTIAEGEQMARDGSIVLFGIRPSFPATGYGYIEAVAGDVISFTEKPSLDKAEVMVQAGHFFWNSGIFLCRSDTLLQALTRHAPDILQSCQDAMAHAQTEAFAGIEFIRPDAEAFANARAQSVDYAVMEREAGLKLVPFEGEWSDVGSWSAVSKLMPSDNQGNQYVGHTIAIDSKNTLVYGQDRVVVSVGIENLVVVDTPDAILIAAKDRAEDVKRAVLQLEANNWAVATSHRKVHRPWGWYDSVDRGERFQVKRILVKPGASLSLQMHNHRAEHWVVVKGTARVVRGKEILVLSENESVYIPIGMSHRLENPGVIDLEIIEIQTGSYLGEDDIVRLEDHYGRS